MKKILLLVIVSFMYFSGQSQNKNNWQGYFNQAYAKYDNLPQPLLEAMAYSASHLQPINPETEADLHGKPARVGLFALIEDGKGYFNNTMKNVCALQRLTPADFKANPGLQIMAVAHYLSVLFEKHKVHGLSEAMPVLQEFCEIPNNGTVNAFARDAYAYEIFYQLTNGFVAGDVRVQPQKLNGTDWFTEENFRVLQAPVVTIENNAVRSGNNTYQPGVAADAVAVTDYPPALWVTSPNFSSRGTTAISAVAIHTMQGSYSGSISWFQNTASQVSAHYMVRSSDGQITQMVREASKAWHIGSENPYTVGIEHEGFVADASWYTTAMYNASSALTKDICTDNGIATTACYNGASSSGIVLLSSAIKIKGHQHFPNQSHTDPGINWDWPRYYNLLNPVSCNATTTLNESFISTAFANLNWSAVTGAASYSVEYKAASATLWNAVSSANNYKTIAGLSASTAYNWRVKTNCSNGGASAFSATQTFTTQASCWDANEPNNVYTAPSTYSLAGFTYGKICASGDIDFYKVTTSATQNITFNLQTLPKNYNIETYTGAGAYLAGGYATGTADETVTLFNKPAGSYLFRVYGATATDNDAINDYRLQVVLSAPTIARMSTASVVNENGTVSVFPNPVRDVFNLSWQMPVAGQVHIEVTDYFNRNIYLKQQYATEGAQKITLNTNGWKEGMYVVRISYAGGTMVQRFMVTK
jgi:N-acetyl-anhydromuramyl-L-alanine amidase AmpD